MHFAQSGEPHAVMLIKSCSIQEHAMLIHILIKAAGTLLHTVAFAVVIGSAFFFGDVLV